MHCVPGVTERFQRLLPESVFERVAVPPRNVETAFFVVVYLPMPTIRDARFLFSPHGSFEIVWRVALVVYPPTMFPGRQSFNLHSDGVSWSLLNVGIT